MKEIHEQLTHDELTEIGRSYFDQLLERYRRILNKHNISTIREFIKAEPNKNDIKRVTRLLKEIKTVVQTKTTEADIDHEKRQKRQEELQAETDRGNANMDAIKEKHGEHVSIKPFSMGRARMHKQGENFYIDPDGNIIFGPFDKGPDVIESEPVHVSNSESQEFLINIGGKIITGPAEFIFKHKKGLYSVKDINGHQIIDKDGNAVIGPYDNIDRSIDHTFYFARKHNGAFCIYDLNGDIITGPFENMYMVMEPTKSFTPHIVGIAGDTQTWIDKNSGEEIPQPPNNLFINNRGMIGKASDDKMYLVDTNFITIAGPFNGHPKAFKDGHFILQDGETAYQIDLEGNCKTLQYTS